MRYLLYFSGTFLLMLAFFYFYPAHVFQANVKAGMLDVTTEVSLQAILHKRQLPEGLNPEMVESISLTAQGYAVLFICLLGVPGLIAYRFGKKGEDVQPENPDN